MRSFFTSILSLHWAAAFFLMASGMLLDVGDGMGRLLSMTGIARMAESGSPYEIGLSIILIASLLFSALLFLWAFLAGVSPVFGSATDQQDILTAGCGAGVVSATLALLCAAATGADISFAPVAIQISALGATFAAANAEMAGKADADTIEKQDVRAAARLMAARAAHGSMLTHLTGRKIPSDGVR